jgi:chaperone modulatory protein CbpM
MSPANRATAHAVLVEEEIEFTFDELCRTCRADDDQLRELIHEGVLSPTGEEPREWRFAGTALRRARVALRLTRDLQLSADAAALVLDLLDEINALEARLALVNGPGPSRPA